MLRANSFETLEVRGGFLEEEVPFSSEQEDGERTDNGNAVLTAKS